MRNRQFKELLTKVEIKLINKLGKNYCGLISLADEITGIYLEKYFKHEYECEYIQVLRRYLLTIDFLDWLNTNYFQFTKEFNFKKKLGKIEEKLYNIKKEIFNNWLNGNVKEEIKELKETKKLNFIKKMYLNLLNDFPTFKVCKIKKFKKELGL
jgi:hypothetical protein